MKRVLLTVTVVAGIAICGCMHAWAEDTKAPAPAEAQAPAPAAPAAAPVVQEPQAKEVSIYGEVQSVNIQANSMSVQYYDYDSDEEKMIDITVAGDVKMENAASLSEVKKGDWLDVSYVVMDGKNMAKTVSVEKEEETPVETMPKEQEPSAVKQ